MEHDLPLIDEQQQQQPKKEKTFHTQSRWIIIILTFLLIWPIVFFLIESSDINQYKAAEKITHKKKKLDCSNNNNYVFQKNSKQWLDSPRHSNINETLITDKQIEELILDISPMKTTDGSKHILGQSLCLAESAFMNWDQRPRITSPTTDNNNDDDKDRIRELAFKLVFLAIHEHQFGPARREALTRYSDERCVDDDSRKQQLEEYKASLKNAKVGKFDFECPDTKYLISDVGSKGFGATMRVGMIDPMFVGLVTNRTVLYVSSFDSHTVDKSFQTPWPLASCPRKDIQCVYMPVTPCVLTKEEIQNGLIVPEKVVSNARKTGTFGEEYDDAKVLMMKSSLGGHKPTPNLLMSTFIRIIESFYANNGEEENETYEESRSSSSSIGGAPWKLDKETLANVSEFLLSGGNYVRWLPHQATSFFLTRPSMESRKKIDDALQRILPDNFDPATTVGFPIRGMFYYYFIFLPCVQLYPFRDTKIMTLLLFIQDLINVTVNRNASHLKITL